MKETETDEKIFLKYRKRSFGERAETGEKEMKIKNNLLHKTEVQHLIQNSCLEMIK